MWSAPIPIRAARPAGRSAPMPSAMACGCPVHSRSTSAVPENGWSAGLCVVVAPYRAACASRFGFTSVTVMVAAPASRAAAAQSSPTGPAPAALGAAAARHPGFERDAAAQTVAAGVRAVGGDDAACLVAEDERLPHDEVADPAVLVVVRVGAAHADGADRHQHLMGFGLGDGTCFEAQVADAVEDGGAVVHRGPAFRSSARSRSATPRWVMSVLTRPLLVIA